MLSESINLVMKGEISSKILPCSLALRGKDNLELEVTWAVPYQARWINPKFARIKGKNGFDLRFHLKNKLWVIIHASFLAISSSRISRTVSGLMVRPSLR